MDFDTASRAAPEGKRSALSGWLVGIVLGVLAGLWAFPLVRSTLVSQLQLALVSDSVPWVRAMDAQRSARELPRLDAAAASAPSDYLMQVGRATALADSGVGRETPFPLSGSGPDTDDRTLVRLAIVARDFPSTPGAYAHLARYMIADRVRIQRAELDAPSSLAVSLAGTQTASAPPDDPTLRSIPARHKDVRLMEWALQAGERRDPNNAFWSAMLAITYFSAMRDDEALRALARASHKHAWDAYIYEEILGQWRLYSTAYGDNGATQKIGPLSLVDLRYLREMRHLAEMARMRAERAAAQGRDKDAVRIRRNIARLSLLLRDSARWAIEALYGTDLFLIATTDSGSTLAQGVIRNVRDWEEQAPHFLAALRRAGQRSELPTIRQQVRACCELRQRVDVARFDASYPGTPPGIPLVPLFGNWMVGIFLMQQALGMALAATLAAAICRYRARSSPATLARLVGFGSFFGLTLTFGVLLFLGAPSVRLALGFLAGTILFAILLLNALFRGWRRAVRKGQAADESLPAEMAEVEARWSGDTTAWMLALLLIPGLITLYLLRPALSNLHPVAALLTSLMGGVRTLTAQGAIQIALLGYALPLAALLTASLWALLRRLSPLAGALVGARRLALPAVACLAFAYLLVLSRTLRLDAAASRAINEAAQNDLQWVLTHSVPDAQN